MLYLALSFLQLVSLSFPRLEVEALTRVLREMFFHR